MVKSSYTAQKLIVYNQHLPYNDKLQDEAEKSFAEIKCNLSRAVLLQELTPGILIWCNRLDTLIRLHGRNFSKEDHILLIKLLYQLMTIPDLEPQFVKCFAVILHKLLKKQELLTRDDIELPWRPLYELVKTVRYSKLVPVGLKRYPHKFIECIIQVVKSARSYFPVESTEEMLLEWRPYMCPFDAVKTTAAYYFTRFLPVKLPQDQMSRGYGMWLSEFMEYWFDCTQNILSVADEYTRLFSRVAAANVGYIDWNPYIPQIFNLFLGLLNLPVNGSVQIGSSSMKGKVTRITSFAQWFVYMIDGDSIVMDHLEKLFSALHSFYHPSNHGRFTILLQGFLNSLTNQFIHRVHNERFRKPSWFIQIPDHAKITDDNIGKFVNLMKDAALLSVFSKVGSLQAAYAIQNLVLLRADIILPSLLERTSEALETLVEPHQVVATLTCVTSVVRTLVAGSQHFPEAPTHVLPLLRLVLPGIDPNDFRKSMCSFTLISGILGLIPLVDCMPALHSGLEMTEVEKELCIASGQFEDFVLQFIDRCFVLVENSTLEDVHEHDNQSNDGINILEGMIGMGLGSTVQTVLMQCSPGIFQAALDSIFVFISTRVLEVNVAGKMVADVCRVAAKAKAKETLKKFLPFMCSRIKNLVTVEGIEEEEHVDTELLWYLELLSEMVRCDGKELILYKDSLMEVLQLTLYLKCKKASSRAAKLLKAVLSSCTEVYTLEWFSISSGFHLPPTEHFYIRDWGKPGDLDELDIKWHFPNKEELEFVNQLVKLFLYPQLEVLSNYVNGAAVTRDELHQRLQLIAVIIYGCGNVLPMWMDRKVEGLAPASMVYSDRSYNISKNDDVEQFQCCVTRKQLAEDLHQFFEYILQTNEDDSKTFRIISKIYDYLLLHHGVNWNEFNMRWKNAYTVKKALADKLHGNKRHVRAVLIERTQLQHDMRVLDRHSTPFTYTDLMIVKDLVVMSTSVYTEVRIHAQKVLFGCLEMYDYASRAILPGLLENLKLNPETSHEKLKGTLYILQYPRLVYLITHYWETVKDTWPAIIRADKSEKPSIVSLINRLVGHLESKFDTLDFDRKVDKKSRDVLLTLLQSNGIDFALPSAEELRKAEKKLSESNAKHTRLYVSLMEELTMLLEDSQQHWRCEEICMKLLRLILTKSIEIPTRTVRVFVKNLVHDSYTMRQFAVKALVAVLHQQKPLFKKKNIDYSRYGIKSEYFLQLPCTDNRTDNAWMQYQPTSAEHNNEDKTIYVDKTHWGFNSWPLELKVYVQDGETVRRDRELNSTELEITKSFLDNAFFEKFIEFFSIEIKKGEDAFNRNNFFLYKGLFRNFGPLLLLQFHTVLKKLLCDNVESKQRCAAEIIAGMIRGSKNWTCAELRSLWPLLCVLIKDVFSTKVIPEVRRDWSISFITATESRDPNRFHELFTMLLDNPVSGTGGSLGDTSRLMLLQNTIAQQEWRVAHIYHSLYNYLKPHFSHPYKSVRDRIGSVLSYIFMCDIKCGASRKTLSPRIEMFVNDVLEDLTALCENVLESSLPTCSSENLQKVNLRHTSPGDEMDVDLVEELHISEENDDEKRKDRIAKTVLSFLLNNSYTMQPVHEQIYKLLPVLIPLEAREDDPELVRLCKTVLPLLASKQLDADMITVAVATLIKVCYYKSWNARKTALNYLKILVFYNFFTLDRDDIKDDILKVNIDRLGDEQLEVREIASSFLSGLIHYGYVVVTKEILTMFSNMAKKRLKRTRHGIVLSAEDMKQNTLNLHVKHGGILGLSSCILAFPYDVPLWMPEVLLDIGNYLHDAPQIQTTVKKTLSDFRRTHHDNWHMHRQKFTDDQLSVLTDLLISPSYYA